MSNTNAQIGQLLKDLREDRGWSLREFGLVVGLNKTYLGDIELGKRNPTINSLERIVAGYGLSLKEFFAKMPDDERARSVAGARSGACYNAGQSVPRLSRAASVT